MKTLLCLLAMNLTTAAVFAVRRRARASGPRQIASLLQSPAARDFVAKRLSGGRESRRCHRRAGERQVLHVLLRRHRVGLRQPGELEVQCRPGAGPVAPGVFKYKGYFYMSGNTSPLYRTSDILGPYESLGTWKDEKGQPWTGTALNGRTWNGSFDVFFVVDNDRPYLYYPGRGPEGIYVVPLDPNDLTKFAAAPKHLFSFDKSHIWERYGEFNEYSNVSWIEGPWVIKHDNTYYLEYSASGTQWLSYATGVYTSKSPLGPFAYCVREPYPAQDHRRRHRPRSRLHRPGPRRQLVAILYDRFGQSTRRPAPGDGCRRFRQGR